MTSDDKQGIGPEAGECCATCLHLGVAAEPPGFCKKHGIVLSETASRGAWCLAWTEKVATSDNG